MDKKKTKLSASNLKTILWDTLGKVRSNNIDADEAMAISGMAREIVRTTSTQLKVAVYSRRPISKDVLDFTEN